MPHSITSGLANLATATLACGWTFTAFASVAVICLYRHRRYSIGINEGVTFGAFGTGLLLVVQTTWAVVDEGQGKHRASLSRLEVERVARSLFANELLWAITNSCVRVSGARLAIALFGISRFVRNFATILVAATIIHGSANILLSFLICRPLQASWGSGEGRCGNQKLAYLVFEVLGIVLDVGILTIPIRPIPQLHTSLKNKLVFMVVLSAGSVVMIISGLRIQAMSLVDTEDISYNGSYIGLLSQLGGLIGIIACCLPSVVAVFHKGIRENSILRSIYRTTLHHRSWFGSHRSQPRTAARRYGAFATVPRSRVEPDSNPLLGREQPEVTEPITTIDRSNKPLSNLPVGPRQLEAGGSWFWSFDTMETLHVRTNRDYDGIPF